MKRLIGVLLCLGCLSGCAGALPGDGREREVLDALTPHYETDASFLYGGETVQMHIAHPTPEQCEVRLLAPESVAGLTFRFRQDNVDLSYGELSFSLDPDGMPGNAPAKLVVDALAQLLRTDDTAALAELETGWELRAELPGTGECVLVLGGEDSVPQKLFLVALDWEIALDHYVVFA